MDNLADEVAAGTSGNVSIRRSEALRTASLANKVVGMQKLVLTDVLCVRK